jgi:uncharacterized membrane protein YkvI
MLRFFLKNEIKDTLKISSVYITTVIGAGFASGQEIIYFFTRYGKGGTYGIVFAGLLFIFSGYIVLDRVYLSKARNFTDFIFPMTGSIFGKIIETISTLFLFSVYCVMIAGMGNVLSELTKLSQLTSNIIISIIAMIIIIVGVEGVAKLSVLLAPFLIMGILGIGIFIILLKDKEILKTINVAKSSNLLTSNWLLSSIVYVSYNNILSTAVLSNLLPYLKIKRTALISSFLGGFFLCFLAIVLNIALSSFSPHILLAEFPIIEILQLLSIPIKKAYNVILIFAMLTSAAASGHSSINGISSWLNMKTKTTTILICVAGIPLSSLGFSKLITTVYPFFGYTGLFMLILLIFDWLKNKLN